ncbi:MAG: sigma-70 family RNA polymerase sigma factor [Candidatus Firestonebacteria bacterium]
MENQIKHVSPESSDEELMLAVKTGNSYPFEILYNRYKFPIISYICRMMQNYQKAEDLTQETFLKLLKKKDLYIFPKKFSSWLYKIATNICLDEIRRSKFHSSEEIKEVVDSKEITEEIETKEKEQIIKKVINSLSAEHKSIIVLKQYQGLKNQEIAEILGKDLNWVKWHLKCAYDELEERLKPYFTPFSLPSLEFIRIIK